MLLVMIVKSIATGQNTDNEKLDWWGDVDGFISQQDKITLDLVEEAMSKYPANVCSGRAHPVYPGNSPGESAN